MAKEFKEWDKVFSNEEIEDCRRQYVYPAKELNWIKKYKQPSAEKVRWAVYEAQGHREWQLFRVSLKGLNTWDKMRALKNYFDKTAYNISSTQEQIELACIRVNNYIGALRRGGQLNAALEIVK